MSAPRPRARPRPVGVSLVRLAGVARCLVGSRLARTLVLALGHFPVDSRLFDIPALGLLVLRVEARGRGWAEGQDDERATTHRERGRTQDFGSTDPPTRKPGTTSPDHFLRSLRARHPGQGDGLFSLRRPPTARRAGAPDRVLQQMRRGLSVQGDGLFPLRPFERPSSSLERSCVILTHSWALLNGAA